MKRGEDPLVTARREIEEETGLTFPDQLPYRAQRLKGAIYFYFACDPLLPWYEAKPHDAWEVEEVRWVTLQDMSELPTNSGIKDFLKRQDQQESDP
jgi:8-oxo-dGTP pyrophosphatase MutT (NUDIX family)